MNYSLRIKQINNLIFLIPIALISLFCSAFKVGNGKSETRRRTRSEVQQLRQDITGYAQNFVGLKYHYSGTSTRTGFDCSGFTSYIMKEFDVKVSPSSSTQSNQGIKVDLSNVQAGDLIFFGGKRHIQHVAMVVERTEEGIICVHSTNSRGIVVENVSISDYWRPKILFARDVISPQMLE
jgi:cell wall-associated NlpC family hydrolase